MIQSLHDYFLSVLFLVRAALALRLVFPFARAVAVGALVTPPSSMSVNSRAARSFEMSSRRRCLSQSVLLSE